MINGVAVGEKDGACAKNLHRGSDSDPLARRPNSREKPLLPPSDAVTMIKPSGMAREKQERAAA